MDAANEETECNNTAMTPLTATLKGIKSPHRTRRKFEEQEHEIEIHPKFPDCQNRNISKLRIRKWNILSQSSFLLVTFLIVSSLLNIVLSKSESTDSKFQKLLLAPQPTSVSKAYTHLDNSRNFTRKSWRDHSSNSRPFFVKPTSKSKTARISEENAISIGKPSKLFTNDKNLEEGVFRREHLFQEKYEEVSSTTQKSRNPASSPFVTQTDTGPKIRLEPFFNILNTFQSLALGTSKEQKFSPSYQAVTESFAEAEAKRRHKTKGKVGKGQKGLRKGSSKRRETTTTTTPYPTALDEEEGDILTLEYVEKEHRKKIKPMDVLSFPMSATLSLGEEEDTVKVKKPKMKKGTVEEVAAGSPKHEALSFMPNPTPKSSSSENPESRGLPIFQDFHGDNDNEFKEDQLSGTKKTKRTKANIPSGYALPEDEDFYHNPQKNVRMEGFHDFEAVPPTMMSFGESRPHPQHLRPPIMMPYSPQFPPPGLGVPPTWFKFRQGNPNHPHYNNGLHPHHHLPLNEDLGPVLPNNMNRPITHKPFSATSDLNAQSSNNLNKIDTSGHSPNQKIGFMDPFELFYKEYKVLTWAAFLILTALSLLCLVVFLYVNNPPTEVVTAKDLTSGLGLLNNQQILKFLESLVLNNEKMGGTGKRKRKRFKMQRRVFKDENAKEG